MPDDKTRVQITSEWEAIQKTIFWKEFVTLFKARYKDEIGKCAKFDVPELYRAQGAVRNMELIKDFPKKVTELPGAEIPVS